MPRFQPFSFVAPTIWNSLPIHLRSLVTASTMATFIKHLKSYLSTLAYPVWSRDYHRAYPVWSRDYHRAYLVWSRDYHRAYPVWSRDYHRAYDSTRRDGNMVRYKFMYLFVIEVDYSAVGTDFPHICLYSHGTSYLGQVLDNYDIIFPYLAWASRAWRGLGE